MRVKMILDLVNRMRPGAREAARDIKSIKTEAKDLARQRGPEKATRDILQLGNASKQGARHLREVKTAARETASARGPEKLARDLDRTGKAAARAARELKATRAAARDWARTSALGESAAAQKGSSTAAGAAMLAAGRNALLPLAAAYGGYRGAGAGIRGTVGKSVSFEKAMAEVLKKVDGMDDPAELAKMEQLINRSAIAYGRAREEVAALVAEAGAGGVSRADMPEFVRINLAAATAWDASASQAGNALAKIRAATQWANPALEEFVDKVNALADAGSAKEMDVVDMFQRAGAAAKAAGVEFDTSLAFLTAMNNVAIAPEVASRGFAAFSSKLRTASDQGKKVAEGLKDLGLTPGGVEQGMKENATGTMIDVLERLEKSADKASAAIKVFGREWWDEVARAGQALPEIRKNLEIVRDPETWKGSAQKNLNIQLATTDNHLTRLSALASQVGDRLGRWALPAINEGIEKIIAGMDALDARAQARKDAESLAVKSARGEALSPEEREKLANDRQFAASVTRRSNQISAQQDWRETAARSEGAAQDVALRERALLLRRQIERQIKTLEAELKLTPDGFGDRGKTRRLASLRRQLADIPYSPSDRPGGAVDPRRPADQGERAGQLADGVDRAAVMALKERIVQLEGRLRTLDELRDASSNPADKAGFTADRLPYLQRRAQAEGEFRRRFAPTVAAAGNFGLGAGGAPASARPSGAGPAIASFGLSVENWAQSIRDGLDVDLGPAGMTMMERLTAGIRSGGAGAEGAADGVKSSITGAFAGADLSGAGSAMMATLTSGIRAGGAQAIAEAQRVASQVKAAAASGAASSSGRPRAISGALHDGVE